MKRRATEILKENVDVAGIFILMTAIFSYVMFVVEWHSDLPAHVDIAKQMLEQDRLFTNNFLMYFLVNFFTLFRGEQTSMRIVLTLLISLSNTVKYILIRNYFQEQLSRRKAELVSLSLLFVYVIPIMYFLKVLGIFMSASNMYLGYYVPNVWHNSTILCMMPFAIITYLLTIRQFDEYSDNRTWKITLFLVLSILIKPSFFFIYAVSYPTIMLFRYGFKRDFIHSLIPICFGFVCLLYEYFTIYVNGGNDDSGVVIDIMPLFSIGFWKSHVLYLLVSIAFPLLFVCLYWRSLIREKEFWFVALMLICALGIYWCCRETGPRAEHSNFYWQIVAAMWFVYFYILKRCVSSTNITQPSYGGGYSRHIVLTLYNIHVVFGIIYLLKFLITKDFG